MARAPPGPPLHAAARPAGAPLTHRASPGATATSPATRATSSAGLPSASASPSPADYLDSPDGQRHQQQLLQYPGLGAGQLRPVRQVRRAVSAHPLAAQAARLHHLRRRRPTTPSASGYKATRTDAQLRMSLRSRDDGTGTGLDLIYARSAWDGAGLDQQINQIGGYLVLSRADVLARRLRLSPHALDAARLRGRRSAGRRRAVLPRAREACCSTISAAGTATTCSLAAGLQPVRGLALTGTARVGRAGGRAVDPHRYRAADCATSQAQLGWDRGTGSASRSGTPGRRRSVRSATPNSSGSLARAVARGGLAHGECAGGAGPVDHAGELVQRSAEGHRRWRAAHPLADDRHHPVEVPAQVSAAASST